MSYSSTFKGFKIFWAITLLALIAILSFFFFREPDNQKIKKTSKPIEKKVVGSEEDSPACERECPKSTPIKHLETEEEKIEKETEDLIHGSSVISENIKPEPENTNEGKVDGQEGPITQTVGKTVSNSQKSDDKKDNLIEDEYSPLFTNQELKELENAGADLGSKSTGSLLPGVVSKKSSATILQPEPEDTSDDEDLEEDEVEVNLENRLTGQARGYSMLYLMHPRARQTVERQVQAMLESELNELYLGVLTDGTFGKDFEYLSNIVKRLSADQRKLCLALYLTNGATMRHHDVTSIDAGFTKIDPEYFRELIQYNPEIRLQFTNMVAEVKPIFELNRSLNPENRNIAIVMLEDNLRESSYRAMRDLTYSVLGGLVSYVRNPCPGCLPDNDTNTLGDGLELHNPNQLAALSSTGGYTLDGKSYQFPGENSSSGLTIEEVLLIQAASLNQKVGYFGLWREERQGLRNNQHLHPDQRSYEIPSIEQIEIEKQILREGLGYLIPREIEN